MGNKARLAKKLSKYGDELVDLVTNAIRKVGGDDVADKSKKIVKDVVESTKESYKSTKKGLKESAGVFEENAKTKVSKEEISEAFAENTTTEAKKAFKKQVETPVNEKVGLALSKAEESVSGGNAKKSLIQSLKAKGVKKSSLYEGKLVEDLDVSELREEFVDMTQKQMYKKIINELSFEYDSLSPRADETSAFLDDVITKFKSTKKADSQPFMRAIYSGEKDFVEEGFQKLDKDDLKKLASEAYNRTTTLRELAYKNALDANRLSMLDLYSSTMKTELSNIYAYAKKNGLEPLALQAENVHNFVDSASVLEAKINNLKKSVDYSLRKKHSETELNRIREYIEKFNIENVSVKNNDIGGLNVAMPADAKLAQEMNLSVGELETAVKIQNMNRELRKISNDVRVGKYNTVQDMQSNFDSYTSEKLADRGWMPEDGFGDQGYSYFHRKFKDIDGSFMSSQQARKIDSAYAMDYNNRVGVLDELDDYWNELQYDVLDRALKQKVGMLKGYASSGTLASEVAKRFTSKAKRGLDNNVYKGVFPLVDILEKHVINATKKADRPQTVIGKVIANLADAQTVYSLSSPRMAMFNLAQPLINTTAWVGIGDVTKAYHSYFTTSPIKLAKELGISLAEAKELYKKQGLKNAMSSVLKKPILRQAFNDLRDTKRLSSIDKYSMNYYMERSMQDIMFRETFDIPEKLKPVMDLFTATFRFSDISTRQVSVLAYSRQAEKVVGNILADDLAAGNIPKAFQKATQELSLSRFRDIELKRLYNSLVKNPKEFIAEYTRLGVSQDIYDYSKYNRQFYSDLSKNNWLAQKAVRFLSWNAYYTEYMKSVSRAYMAGNTKPAKNLALLGVTWFAGMSMAAGADNETVANFGSYGISRTPVLNMLGTGTRIADNAGIAGSGIYTLLYPAIAGFDYVSDLISGKTKNRDSFDYMKNTAKSKSKQLMPFAMTRKAYEFIEED